MAIMAAEATPRRDASTSASADSGAPSCSATVAAPVGADTAAKDPEEGVVSEREAPSEQP